MKITGADGLTPEMIRDEVDRGGRLVIYLYCVSIVLMTFKRTSSVHFIRAGQSPVMRGLPFSILTFFLGWWGFPWGPIYTIESLYKNFMGGVDVTDEVLATLVPPRLPTASSSAATLTTSPRPARRPARQLSPRQIALGVPAIIAVVVGIYAAICSNIGNSRRVAVLNGFSAPATYNINGADVAVPALGYTLLELPEGDFHIGATPAHSAETFNFSTPFWSRPFNARLAVINPDRAAIFYHYHVIYKADHAEGDNHGQPTTTTFYANQSHYVFAAPDYVFEDAPANVSMPDKKRFTSKTRLALDTQRDLDDRLATLVNTLGEDAAQAYARNLTLNEIDDESVLVALTRALPPATALTFIETRLEERPLRVDWHRYYQNLVERLHPETDLRARYTALAASEPDEGGTHYLLGRLEVDASQARAPYERALSAARPCAHGHLGLAYLEKSQAHFAEALSHYDQAIQGGLKNESALSGRREMLLALGRREELLADIRQRRLANPWSLALAAEEIHCTLGAIKNEALAKPILETALLRNRADTTEDDRQRMRAYLNATVSYALGDEASFANSAAPLGMAYTFQAAISRRDQASASAALEKMPYPPTDYMFILHLVALQKGDTDAAQTYWTKAIELLHQEGGGTEQRAAAQLSGTQPLDPQWFRTAALPVLRKSLIFTSLGLRDASQRKTYFEWASQYNYSPEFPCLLIRSIIKPETQVTRL